jgi:hypothetical protein
MTEDQDRSPHTGLEEIEPLIEYYARQMGQLSGRLMTALSFLEDVKNSHSFSQKDEQVQRAVHYSSLLVTSVLRMVAASQENASRAEQEAAAAVREALDIINRHQTGGEEQPS